MLYEAYVIDDVTTRYAHLTKQCNTAAEIILHIDFIHFCFPESTSNDAIMTSCWRHFDVIMTSPL